MASQVTTNNSLVAGVSNDPFLERLDPTSRRAYLAQPEGERRNAAREVLLQMLPSSEVSVRDTSSGSSLSNHSLLEERSRETSGASTTLLAYAVWTDRNFAREMVAKVFPVYKFLGDGNELFNSRFCLKVFSALRETPSLSVWSGKIGYFQRAKSAIQLQRSTVTSTMKYVYIGMSVGTRTLVRFEPRTYREHFFVSVQFQKKKEAFTTGGRRTSN